MAHLCQFQTDWHTILLVCLALRIVPIASLSVCQEVLTLFSCSLSRPPLIQPNVTNLRHLRMLQWMYGNMLVWTQMGYVGVRCLSLSFVLLPLLSVYTVYLSVWFHWGWPIMTWGLFGWAGGALEAFISPGILCQVFMWPWGQACRCMHAWLSKHYNSLASPRPKKMPSIEAGSCFLLPQLPMKLIKQ